MNCAYDNFRRCLINKAGMLAEVVTALGDFLPFLVFHFFFPFTTLPPPISCVTIYKVFQSITALTLYDMAKALEKSIQIEGIHLVSKTGGKSGDWGQLLI